MIFFHPLTTFVAADSVNGTNYPDLSLNSSGISIPALEWQEGESAIKSFPHIHPQRYWAFADFWLSQHHTQASSL
jgi:hypothetical protein